MTQPLALRLPMSGHCLIEASAGTGKTYTIADFFVRQLIEGGREIDQILVVTFTRAATAELRDRIRRRIVEAVSVFSTRRPGENATLAGLLATQQEPERVVDDLRAGLVRMDEAPIYTIHSFCQQMLRENAFESGTRFDASFELDEAQLLEQIVQDFWRRRCYPESEAFVGFVYQRWKVPRALLKTIKPCLGVAAPEIRPSVSDEVLASQQSQCRHLWRQIVEAWGQNREHVSRILESDPALSRAKKAYHSERVADMLALMDRLVTTATPSTELPESFAYFAASRLRQGKKPSAKEVPHHPFFELCEAFCQCAEDLSKFLEVQFIGEAVDYVRSEMDARKRALNALSYNDLLTQLHAALTRDTHGLLKKAIRRRFPVALIDEFQDTDAVQYRIFRAIYGSDSDAGLFMIGDPKQAIYSFRGADVFTYMSAKAETPARFTLGTNWRSTPELVAAVNALFGAARAPFVYQQSIPFQAAEAAGKADPPRLRIAGKAPVPLQVWDVRDEDGGVFTTLDPPQERIAELCAAEISRLIMLGRLGEAHIDERPLAAADITVLVRRGSEAALVQRALRRLGIGSVFLTRESVFTSAEAEEVLRVLEAVAEPGSENRLRAALTTRLLGVDASTLYQLQQLEAAWEDCLQRFHGYRDLWGSHGFMVMFQRLLTAEGVIERVLAGVGGERTMTNVRHLGECLQSASSIHSGAEQLVAWYRRAMRDADANSEIEQLRLESDAALVKIITIHKSKGLQYPVVFVPFAWMGKRPTKPRTPVQWHPDTSDRQCIDYGSPDLFLAFAGSERERLAEDVRLLYVALTRAEHLCYLPFVPLIQKRPSANRSGLPDSALAWLLYSRVDVQEEDTGRFAEAVAALGAEQLRTPWERLAGQQSTLIAFESPPEVPATPSPIQHPVQARAALRVFAGSVEASWEMTSYSRLSHTGQTVSHARSPDRLGEAGEADTVIAASATPLVERTPLTLPRGRDTGNLVHAILEQLDFPLAHGEALTNQVVRQMLRYGFEPEWQSSLETLVGNTLDARLGGSTGFALREIEAAHRLAELEFHFLLGRLLATDLDPLVREISRAGNYGPALGFDTVQGFLTGFVDLVVEHQDRFFVIDYKTNFLGERPADYQGEGLLRAIGEHRYDLQYLLYVVALHRYLRYRISDYDYDTHFGGVYYLFVRGMSETANADSGIYFDRPTSAQVEVLDALLGAR